MWAKQVWYKDGKLQTYSNRWEEVNVWPTPTPIPVTGVSLDQQTATIQLEETLQLTATVAPSDATNKEVTWTTSDNTIATVSSTGLVTAAAEGEVTITVTTTDGNFTDTCSVTVNNGQHEVQEVKFSGYSSEDPLYLTANRSNGIQIQVTPYTASNVEVEVTSEDSSILGVGWIYYDDQPTEWSIGGVTLFWVNPWNTTVTVRSVENPNVFSVYNIVVEQDVPVQSVSNLSSASGDAYKYEAGGDTRGIATFDYSPSNAVRPQEDINMSLKEGENNIWYGWIQSTSEPGVAQINFQVDPNAQVGDSAVYELTCREQEATRWAKSRNVPLEIEITVGEWVSIVENLNLDPIEVEMGQTNTSKTFTYSPSNADFNSIVVESNSPFYFSARAVKDSDGVWHIEVTGLQTGWGSVNIFCGYWYSSSISVNVIAPQIIEVESVSNPSPNSLEVPLGEYRIVNFDIYPSNANAFNNLSWATSDPSIYVDDTYFFDWGLNIHVMWNSVWSGLLNCLVNWEDQGITVSVEITDPQPQASLTIDTTQMDIEEGQTENKSFTYTPIDADFSEITLNNTFPGVATATLVKDSDGNGHIEVSGVSAGWTTIELSYAETTYNFYVAVTTPVIPVTAVSNFSTTTISITEWQTNWPTFEVTPANANDSSTISLSFGTPGVAQLSSISLNPGYSALMSIEWLSAGTTTADILVDGVSTGITLDITVTQE